ncbi:hypothetical protein FB567DRAFT_586223 [Paraphoma chrysanthemicola]|uniref:BTB domain-containing protein n=1 Tax=Paraphoma chrysanthemicola TaxID=798071 RepID=A0A8K0RHE8_9PLEO|nr:hypothetical protein FB567DRAFT_586223 [Paraphoma chrysanthemicola]
MENGITSSLTATSSSMYVPEISGKIVKVRVRDDKTFSVHESVLKQSPFFRNALRLEWRELRDGAAIKVSHHRPKIFEIYLKWLYSHAIEEELSSMALVQMYVLGEEMMDTRFQDATIAALISRCLKHKNYPVTDQVNVIYEGTYSTSPARRLLVDFFVYAGDRQWVSGRDLANCFHADFVNDLLEALMTKPKKLYASGSFPWSENPAAYFHSSKRGDDGAAAK